MKKQVKYIGSIGLVMLMSVLFLSSCKDFFDPEQEIDITEDKLYNDWYEYRSIAMGFYGLQQDLVEQLLVLGELRGDLLTVTPNADADLMEIYNFNVSKTNKYASPTNFFKLINATNNFIRVMEREHPEVLNPKSTITNYHKLYGEAVCMRAWTYFNAVKIYGKVPFIHESLATMDEVNSYVNSSRQYVDSVFIIFGRDGFNNDTIYMKDTTLQKTYYDMDMVIDHFTYELENLRAVGVNYTINNPNEHTWEVTTWNAFAKDALLGQMYLTSGDYTRAASHFERIIYNPNDDANRYQLTADFGGGMWTNIFNGSSSGVDYREHIYTIWFDNNYNQQNGLLDFFMPISPYRFMLKPTKIAIHKWETSWLQQTISKNTSNPSLSRMVFSGVPGDPYRGYGASYIYFNLGTQEVLMDNQPMLALKKEGDTRGVNNIMDGMDTIVYKYIIGQERIESDRAVFDEDPFFIVYRAASIHLYLSEIYNYWIHDVNGVNKTELNKAMGLVNYGEYYSASSGRIQRGVRGRVGYRGADDAFNYDNIYYVHDPFNNEITGFINITTSLAKKQQYFEDNLMDERARELAFEGERFYDLMRIAKRRNSPAYLAKAVSSKYPAAKREQIYNYLMDENNWYIHMFD